jgi:aspartate ammonia-lyase
MPHTRRLAMMLGDTRLEHDLLGDRAVPAKAYYGVPE